MLLNDSSRKAIQASPEALSQFVSAITDPVCTVVEVTSKIRAFSKAGKARVLCEARLPTLVQAYSPRNGDPIAHFVLALTDESVSELRMSEQDIMKRISSLVRSGSKEIDELEKLECPAFETLEESSIEEAELLKDLDLTVGAALEGSSGASISEVPISERSLEVRELERQLRLEEYNAETLRVLFGDMEPQDQLMTELYFLHGFNSEDIAVVIDKSTTETEKMLKNAREWFIPRHQDEQLSSPGNQVRRTIDREDLNITESQGVALLRSLLNEYPNLRYTVELLDLVVDSFQFFGDLRNTKDPQLSDFLKGILTDTGLPIRSGSSALCGVIERELHRRYPTAESVCYDPEFSWILGANRHKTESGQPADSDGHFLKCCIEQKFYSPKASHDAPLTVPRNGAEGTRFVRNPLTRSDVVPEIWAMRNARFMLQRDTPHLDAIKGHVAVFRLAKPMLGLPHDATVREVQAAFVAHDICSGLLPDDYEPKSSASAYFVEQVVKEKLQENRERMINRRWANIDDPDGGDAFMARVLGVPATVDSLASEAAKVFGLEIPTGHSFKYHLRTDSRYFDAALTGEELAEANLQKALQDTFTDLSKFTFKAVKRDVGLLRMARLLGAKSVSFGEMRQKVIEEGYLD